ncbi:hypothetical protein [Gordonia humi]|uniref:Uncharacterized protein n=1 Tax=Gordonia humi TaxID=686429 RepID=A0A840F1H6_9ACTN|nr:hypothetical protein [Gordonia humi]MBB4135219.1 hypothetical protein [Gordonia humi]
MAADPIARSSELRDVRLHVGRLLILLAGVIAVVAVLVLILTSAA